MGLVHWTKLDDARENWDDSSFIMKLSCSSFEKVFSRNFPRQTASTERVQKSLVMLLTSAFEEASRTMIIRRSGRSVYSVDSPGLLVDSKIFFLFQGIKILNPELYLGNM